MLIAILPWIVKGISFVVASGLWIMTAGVLVLLVGLLVRSKPVWSVGYLLIACGAAAWLGVYLLVG